MRWCVLGVVLLALGCGKANKPDQSNLTPDEEKVRQHILATANDPTSVEFLEFSPNLTRQEVKELDPKQHKILFGGATEFAVRVRYRAKNTSGVVQFHDEVYVCLDGRLQKPEKNPHGADWKEVLLGRKPPR